MKYTEEIESFFSSDKMAIEDIADSLNRAVALGEEPSAIIAIFGGHASIPENGESVLEFPQGTIVEYVNEYKYIATI